MWKRKSQTYLFRWTFSIDMALQNKEIKKIRLNKNHELHSGNKFEENFAHFKAPSLGARFLGELEIKCSCLALPSSNAESWKLSKFIFDWPLMEPLITKLGTSMKGWRTKFALASHGAPKLVAWRIHERPNVKKCVQPSTFNIESWRPSAFFFVWPLLNTSKNGRMKTNLLQPLLELLNFNFESSKTCWVQIILRLISNFQCQRLEAKHKEFCLDPKLSFQALSLKVPRHAKYKKICIRRPTFGRV